MKPEKVMELLAWISLVERSSAETLGRIHGARFDFRGGAYEMRLAGIAGTSTMSRDAAKESWVRAARKRIARAHDDSLGQPVSETAQSVDVYSPWGSGPVPIERREG